MNRRGFLGRVAAAIAVAPIAAVAGTAPRAEAACAECEDIKAHPVPVPEVFKQPAEIDAMVLAMAHATAVREQVSHQAAFAMLYAMYTRSQASDGPFLTVDDDLRQRLAVAMCQGLSRPDDLT